MTTGYICDRCGETFAGGGKWLQGGFHGNSTPMQSWDLCPDCMERFGEWMDCGQESQDVTGDIERVTAEGELLHERIAELGAQLADAREALDAAWGEREELKAANDRLLVALDTIEGCDNRCKQIESERDRWKDAYGDSERLRLELVKDLEHARKWNDTWRDLVHRYEGLCDELLDERDRLRGELP